MHPITVLSFGYLHPWPDDLPPFDITLDLRRLLADPAHRPEGDMLDSTGLDRNVSKFVLRTPGALWLANHTAILVVELSRFKPVVVGVGCAGGRHRSVAIAQTLADRCGKATVEHLHVHLPRVIREEKA